MILTASIQGFIKAHSLESENEVCGLIIIKDGYYEVIKCNNISDDPENHFIIDYNDYINASEKGEIIATYHSHNDQNKDRFNSLSLFDIEQAKKNNLIYIMYYVPRGTFSVIDPKDSNSKYTGRQFEIGVTDCFTLLRDFYLDELNIAITNYSRTSDWQSINKNLIEDTFVMEGFEVVKDLEYGDVLLFSKSKTSPAEHIGIYIGNNLYLHHSNFENSNVTYYSEFYKRQTKYIIRHKDRL